MPRLNDQLRKAHEHLQSGNIDGATIIIESILRRAPGNPYALCMQGMVRLSVGDAANAVAPLERSLHADPDNGMTLDSAGLAYLSLGRFDDAARVLHRAAALPHAPAIVHMRLGMALLNLTDATAAIQHLQQAVQQAPDNPNFRLNLGQAFYRAGDAASARTQFQMALQHAGDDVGAREGLALSCVALGRFGEAIPHLRFVAAVEPANGVATRALSSALLETGQLDEAEIIARRELEQNPDSPPAYLFLSNLLFLKGNFEEPLVLLEAGYQRTGDGELLGLLTFQYRQTCDWARWQDAWEQLAPRLESGEALGSPFWLLCEPITPAQQLHYTQAWARVRFGNAKVVAPRAARKGGRLRIGYLSSDFQEHAAAYLIADVMEHHDRSQFEIFAYSYGPNDDSAMRRRLRAAFEHFVDIAWEPDDVAAARIRDDQIDILVELKGYTVGDRLTIMAQRPCDIQITWLGYPGTTGAPFVDYLIADQYIIASGEEATCSERVLRMPHCYQPNDRKREIAQPLSRADYGLPEQGFVFCCFNQTYKITPDVFAVWMRLLRRIPQSVLWLVDSNARAQQNLRAQASAHGIDADRLVFAPRKPYAEHLARYKVADLALDTLPYTSHTTLSDALWCECPVVGLRGNIFAARVSGSLLTAAGLPDLITENLADYEQLAYEIATDPSLLQDLRARLEQAKGTAPLFNPALFARDLEQLYRSVVPHS